MYYASGHYLDNRNPTSTESDVLPADTFTDMMVYKARYGGYQDTTPWPWMSFTSVDQDGVYRVCHNEWQDSTVPHFIFTRRAVGHCRPFIVAGSE